MKIEFIKRGAATRLILIFAGWSTDARYYSDCVFDGWDTAVVSDYRDLSMPAIPEQYATVYVFAYSLGVAAASFSDVSAAVKVAICGSPQPVSDAYGIPESVYAGTLDGLNERNLMKFHLRMAGDKSRFESIKTKLPDNPDVVALKRELSSIRTYFKEQNETVRRDARLVRPRASDFDRAHNADKGRDARFVRPSVSDHIKFDRVYIAEDDRIFPKENLKAYWESNGDTEIVNLKSSHAVDIASIIRRCLPDTKAIGEGFARAGKSYNDNAIVQKEICDRICEKLKTSLAKLPLQNLSLLEIGAGSGLLTERWRELLTPEKATYIDLTAMPEFGAAKEEIYINADAERWLEEADEKFDIILSASTIQWFVDPIRFISTVRRHLNHGGIAIISTFVKGNLKELDAIRPCPILYRTAEEYREIPGIQTEEWQRTLTFPSSREMKMHLRLTGVSPRRNKTIISKNQIETLTENSSALLPLELTYRPLMLMVKGNSSSV